jgi:hypothetical protein
VTDRCDIFQAVSFFSFAQLIQLVATGVVRTIFAYEKIHERYVKEILC